MSRPTVPRPKLSRQDRAEQLLECGAVIRNGSGVQYHVHSQTTDAVYSVNLDDGTCDCPDFGQGHDCKHLIAARMAAWETVVLDLCQQHRLSVMRLKDLITVNVVETDSCTPAQLAAVDACNRLLRRQHQQEMTR